MKPDLCFVYVYFYFLFLFFFLPFKVDCLTVKRKNPIKECHKKMSWNFSPLFIDPHNLNAQCHFAAGVVVDVPIALHKTSHMLFL